MITQITVYAPRERCSLRPCSIRLVAGHERTPSTSQVRGSLIRVRRTRYYVDDNGPRINIHAGDAHKCYRCTVLPVAPVLILLEDGQPPSKILDPSFLVRLLVIDEIKQETNLRLSSLELSR